LDDNSRDAGAVRPSNEQSMPDGLMFDFPEPPGSKRNLDKEMDKEVEENGQKMANMRLTKLTMPKEVSSDSTLKNKYEILNLEEMSDESLMAEIKHLKEFNADLDSEMTLDDVGVEEELIEESNRQINRSEVVKLGT